jgi:probable addiction module antidote protein
MTKRKPYLKKFDSADYLQSDEATGVYLEDACETEDPALIAHAVGVVARVLHRQVH